MQGLSPEQLEAIGRVCRANRVARLYLVGSAAGGGFDASRSDSDFLVEFHPHERRGLDDVYFALLESLEALLGRHVDLIERGFVRNPYVRASLERGKVPRYAAA